MEFVFLDSVRERMIIKVVISQRAQKIMFHLAHVGSVIFRITEIDAFSIETIIYKVLQKRLHEK